MAAGHLCDFCEIIARRRWVWLGVLSEFTETKNYLSACNAKSKCGGDSLVGMASTFC